MLLQGVSALGYTVPLAVVLAVLALLVGIGLAVMFWLTLAVSVSRSVRDTRRERVQSDLRDQLLDRMFDPDAEWDEWVEGLSRRERSVVESLLDEYLREVDGRQAERLRDLGTALEIPERAARRLGSRNEFDRLTALTWLTLLQAPETVQETDFTPQTSRERASVARLQYENGTLDDPREGLSLLLENAETEFTVFGQDTLYRIATDDPGALFDIAAANFREWSRPLLIQVLLVCRHLGTSVTTEELSWLTVTLEHDSEAVRAAAAEALGNVGWRSDIRDEGFLTRVVADPSPQVRGAVYEMLADWGDETAIAALTDSLAFETDTRARLTGANALVRHRSTLDSAVARGFADTWAWSSEHAKYDRLARTGSRVSD